MGTDAAKTEEGKWWDWVLASRQTISDESVDQEKYTFFDDLVDRCVLVESLSPFVTPQVLLAAIDQFAAVNAIKMLRPPQVDAKMNNGVWPNYLGKAVLEMEKPEKVEIVAAQLRDYMLMVGGMPRPARAQPAKSVMLVDHPCTRRRTPVNLKIVTPTEENRKLYSAKRQKLVEHLKAANYLRELQEREEEDLHNKQEKNYKELKDKYIRIKTNPELRELRKEYNIMPRR